MKQTRLKVGMLSLPQQCWQHPFPSIALVFVLPYTWQWTVISSASSILGNDAQETLAVKNLLLLPSPPRTHQAARSCEPTDAAQCLHAHDSSSEVSSDSLQVLSPDQ